MGYHEEYMKRLAVTRDCENWHAWILLMSSLGIYDHLPEELQEWVGEQARKQRDEARAGR